MHENKDDNFIFKGFYFLPIVFNNLELNCLQNFLRPVIGKCSV